MRRIVTTIAIIAFTCVLFLRLRYLLLGPLPLAAIRLRLAWHQIARPITGGPAPLFNCHTPEEKLVRNNYSIVLKPGHSIEQHKLAVGRGSDIDAATKSIIDVDDFMGSQIVYDAMIEDVSLLCSIRADYGVELVECEVQDVIPMGVLVDECRGGLEQCVKDHLL